jgi:hypothetical protein
MPGQETCAPPVIVTLPAQINAATAEQAAGQISAAFTPCGARLLDLAWLAESSGLGSSLSDLLNRLLPRALPVRLRDGAGPA